jgi:hypothetical protein
MTEIFKHDKKEKETSLDSHNKLNKLLSLEEDFEYWQDKLLTSSISKAKEDFEYKKKLNFHQSILTESLMQTSGLENKLSQLKEQVRVLKIEEDDKKDRSNKLSEEIEYLKKQNESLYLDCRQRYSYIGELNKPDVLLSHLSKFDEDSLKNLCIRLNKLVEQKNHYLMYKMHQQQIYNQMIMNGGQGYYVSQGGLMGGMPAGGIYPQTFPGSQSNENGESDV